jgi:hypothetical protein
MRDGRRVPQRGQRPAREREDHAGREGVLHADRVDWLLRRWCRVFRRVLLLFPLLMFLVFLRLFSPARCGRPGLGPLVFEVRQYTFDSRAPSSPSPIPEN